MVDTVNNNNDIKKVSEWLELDSLSLKKGNTSYTYLQALKDGIPFRSVQSFLNYSTLTWSQVSKLIHVSESILQRSPPERVMDLNSAERLLQLTRLFIKGNDVFNNDKSKLVEWINRPSKSMGFSKPIKMMETTLGMGIVLDELRQIEHGVFS